ncbi:hypothetical protein ACICHK_41665 (plasmid) [Streptomyces sp. AHU1]
MIDAGVIHQLQGRNPDHQPFCTYLRNLLSDYADMALEQADHDW